MAERVPDPFVNIRAFRKKHGLTYPILSDEKMTIISKFGFTSIPSNVILDKNGKYVASPGSVEEMVSELNKLTS